MSAADKSPPCLKGGGPKGRGDTPPPNPCKGCPRRHSHCHAHCKPYLAFYAWNREQNEKNLRQAEVNALRMKGVNRSLRYAHQMKGKKT